MKSRDVSLFKYLEFKIIGYIYIKVRFIKSIECEYDYAAYKLHKWKIIFSWEAHGVKNKLPGILEKRREGWGTFLVMDSSLSRQY